jgi:hypothetical protein
MRQDDEEAITHDAMRITNLRKLQLRMRYLSVRF